MWNEVQWIKIHDMELRDKQILHGDLGGRFAYFRLEQELPADARLTARITAVPVIGSGSTIKPCCPAPARAI